MGAGPLDNGHSLAPQSTSARVGVRSSSPCNTIIITNTFREGLFQLLEYSAKSPTTLSHDGWQSALVHFYEAFLSDRQSNGATLYCSDKERNREERREGWKAERGMERTDERTSELRGAGKA